MGVRFSIKKPAGWCRHESGIIPLVFSARLLPLATSGLRCPRRHPTAHEIDSSSLLRVLGLSFGLAVIVGNTIGGGILRTPGDIASLLPSPWSFVGIWVVGGLYALLGANALAELGTMLPRSGGQYIFARHAFGDYAGFLVGWVDWISTCASTGAIALVLGESSGESASLPARTAPADRDGGRRHLHGAARARHEARRSRAARHEPRESDSRCSCSSARASSFAGRAHMSRRPPGRCIADDVRVRGVHARRAGGDLHVRRLVGPDLFLRRAGRSRRRQIPRSMFYGLLSVAVIYLLINIAFVYRGADVRAGRIAARRRDRRARHCSASIGEMLVRIVVVASMPSAVNACLLMASRVLYSWVATGSGPRPRRRSTQGGTPVASLIATGAVALAFLATGTFETMIAIAAFFFVADYSLSFHRRVPAAPSRAERAATVSRRRGIRGRRASCWPDRSRS